MNKYIAILLLAFSISTPAFAGDSLDERCGILSQNLVSKIEKIAGSDYYVLREVSHFYSNKFDMCVYVEKAVVGVEVSIRDLSRTILRSHAEMHNQLLHCDVDGVNSVILSKVKEHRGRLDDVPYKEYLDDGFGGPPATLHTSSEPYTKEQCKQVFEKWMSILK